MNTTTLTSTLFCPACTARLCIVKQDENSMLNAEQFDSLKAGDYYCPNCPPTKEGLKYRYFNTTDAAFITASTFTDKVNLAEFSEEFVAACREMKLPLETLTQSSIKILEHVWDHGRGVASADPVDLLNLLILQEKANMLNLSASGPAKYGYELVHVFMTSDIVQPRYKKLYEEMTK
jgi:hypothetical protein